MFTHANNILARGAAYPGDVTDPLDNETNPENRRVCNHFTFNLTVISCSNIKRFAN